MSTPVRRRFYRSVETHSTLSGAEIRLDGRVARTPGGNALVLPTSALAELVVNEWRSQRETIRPETMPHTRLAATAIDAVGTARDAVINGTVKYAQSDLLCYRDASSLGLAGRQDESWQPVLDWLAAEFNVPLLVARGVMPVAQPEASIVVLRSIVAGHSDFGLAGLTSATTLLGSIVLALAVSFDRLGVEEAWLASRLDEDWQAARWGEDAEAAARAGRLREDLVAAAHFLDAERILRPA
jgi:chaperone required for assembly of F1-ATPase